MKKSTLFLLAFLLVGWPLIVAVPEWIAPVEFQDLVTDRIVGFYLPTIAVEWLIFALMLLILRLEKENFSSIWWRGFTPQNLAVAVAFLFAASGVLYGVELLLPALGLKVDQNFSFLVPKTQTERWWWVALSVTAGICEEATYRGYLLTRMRRFSRSWVTPVMWSSLSFGIAHSYQGKGGIFLIILYSIMLSLLCIWRKSIVPGILAHSLFDLVEGLYLPGK